MVGLGGALLASHRYFRFSRVSYTLIFLFLALHEIGAHYTYSLVPYDAWSQRWLGFSLDAALGFKRNQFDRAIHFAYGLLLRLPDPRGVPARRRRCAASGATSCRSTSRCRPR